MDMQEKLARARVKIKLNPFITMVKMSPGLAFKIPDAIVDSLTDEQLPLVKSILEENKLAYRNGLWEVR